MSKAIVKNGKDKNIAYMFFKRYLQSASADRQTLTSGSCKKNAVENVLLSF